MKFTAIFVIFMIVCNVFVGATKTYRADANGCLSEDEVKSTMQKKMDDAHKAGYDEGFPKGKAEGKAKGEADCQKMLNARD